MYIFIRNMRLLLIIFYTLSISKLYSQEKDKIIFYDKDWKQTTQAEASYKGIVQNYYSDPDFYYVTDFFITGEKQMEGRYLDSRFLKKDGTFVYYFKNGRKKSITNFKDNTEHGNFLTWYQDGNPELEGNYLTKINREKNYYTVKKIETFYDSTGLKLVKNGNGFYYECIEGTSRCSTGKILRGYKHDEWTGYDTLVSLTYKEVYKGGELQSGESVDAWGNKYKYEELWQQPQPEGGNQKFYEYLSTNLKYPEKSRKRAVEGVVYIKFRVLLEGKVTDVQVIKGLEQLIDEEAVRVVKSSKIEWKPAKKRGKEFEQYLIIPIRFSPN